MVIGAGDVEELSIPEGFHAVCPRLRPRCGWVSYGWPTQEQADMRLAEHEEEHQSGEAAPELFLSEAAFVDLPEDEIEMRKTVHEVSEEGDDD